MVGSTGNSHPRNGHMQRWTHTFRPSVVVCVLLAQGLHPINRAAASDHRRVEDLTGLAGWEECTLEQVDVGTVKQLSDFTSPVLLTGATAVDWREVLNSGVGVGTLLDPVREHEVEIRLPLGINQVRASKFVFYFYTHTRRTIHNPHTLSRLCTVPPYIH